MVIKVPHKHKKWVEQLLATICHNWLDSEGFQDFLTIYSGQHQVNVTYTVCTCTCRTQDRQTDREPRQTEDRQTDRQYRQNRSLTHMSALVTRTTMMTTKQKQTNHYYQLLEMTRIIMVKMYYNSQEVEGQ